jgi:aryl-alcohol dehydrogenase-like predicted oxidoreductase
VERGVNFLYWGSLRRPGFGRAIREAAAAHGRDRIAVVVQSYARIPATMGPSLWWALKRLGFDHADVLLLGWWNSPPKGGIVEAAVRLKEKGLARALMVSGHNRPALLRMAREGPFDAIMVRYNAAHRGAEREVFPHLGEERPGVVAYTATRWGTLLKPLKGMPPGVRVPSATDCYRFCLSHPSVDLVLCGPANRAELDQALGALDLGPLSPEEIASIQAFGDLLHQAYRSEDTRVPWRRVLANLTRSEPKSPDRRGKPVVPPITKKWHLWE